MSSVNRSPSLVPQLLGQASTAGRLYGLLQHVHYLQSLTQLAAPLLPDRGNWQVAAYDGRQLCLATDEHHAASQLRYLQQHYIQVLRTVPELQALQTIRILVQPVPQKRRAQHQSLPPLSTETRNRLLEVTQWIQDAKLNQVLTDLATPFSTTNSK